MNILNNSSEEKLNRSELRYVFDPKYGIGMKEILVASGLSPIKYENPIVQTVYLTAPNLKVPNSGYLRLRRYISASINDISSLHLNPSDLWFLECKSKMGSKARVDLPLGEALSLLNHNRSDLFNILHNSKDIFFDFPFELIPIAASLWQRSHFVFEDMESRATLDEDIRYYGFKPHEYTGKYMGDAGLSKLEFKGDEDYLYKNTDLIQDALMPINYEEVKVGWHEDNMRRFYSNNLI